MASKVKLYGWQAEALGRLRSGSILNGGVGSGKTLTGLVYYKENYSHMPLVVITTPKKRDTGDWVDEACQVGIKELKVDSWNNISHYTDVHGSFFIFDEQRAVGHGAWSKALIKITRKNGNPWIMLTGTPGDNWYDYLTVFIANGFYKNKTEFDRMHVEFDRFAKYPKVKAFHNQSKLLYYRRKILVPMAMERKTTRKSHICKSQYNLETYSQVVKMRTNPFNKDRPIKTPAEGSNALRRIVSIDKTRQDILLKLMNKLDKVIVFYNYNYERDIILNVAAKTNKAVAEWNGHRHEEIPNYSKWIYVVQYTSGAEGWNCIETNQMIFYSPNYSYKIMEQAKGRIDRLNTPFSQLHYYYLRSDSTIDRSVFAAIERKKKFNASAWAKEELNLFAKDQKEALARIQLSSGLNNSYSSAVK